MFGEGNVVILQSCASLKSLRIVDGTLDGKGGREAFAQFKVHVRRPGVVALQNIHEPENWLAVFQNDTIGTVWKHNHTLIQSICFACIMLTDPVCIMYIVFMHAHIVYHPVGQGCCFFRVQAESDR